MFLFEREKKNPTPNRIRMQIEILVKVHETRTNIVIESK